MDDLLTFRLATREDLPRIVNMLADDKLGATRENIDIADLNRYIQAFENIQADPNNELTVAILNNEM